MIQRNDPCWCGSGIKWKKCHFPATEQTNKATTDVKYTDFDKLAKQYHKQYGIILKTKPQIDGIRRSSRLASMILEEVCKKAKEGTTTEELNTFAHELHLKHGAIPAPLGYGHPPFPKSICTSLNEVICHGIPDNTKLKNGDIMNIDVTCIVDGFYGDCSKMVVIGSTDPERQRVVDCAYDSLMESIKILRPGVLISEIGDKITEIADTYGCSIVRQFVGHGVGVGFHEQPQIPHYANDLHIPLVPGMTFTIEPMINAGVYEAVIDKKDHWTARTKDKKPSAQWEHTILITQDGHEILSNWKR